MAHAILLNNVSADTISDEFMSNGGEAVINVRGDNFGGGTVTIEVASKNDPGMRFIPLPSGSFTMDASVKIDYLPTGSILRAQLSGSTGASNVFVDLLQ